MYNRYKQPIKGKILQIVRASPIYEPSDNISVRFRRPHREDIVPEFWNLETTVDYSGQPADEKCFLASFVIEFVPRAHSDALVRILSLPEQRREELVQIIESIAAQALNPGISQPSLIRIYPALPEHKEFLVQRGYTPAPGGFCSKHVSDLQKQEAAK